MIKKIVMPLINYPHHAFLTAPVTVEKVLPLAWKGDIFNATLEKDYVPGLYGFTSLEKRDKFVSMINNSNDFKPCQAVQLY